VHAFHIKGPVKITGMSDSVSRRKIFICKPASPAEERPCAEKIVSNLAEHAFRRPVKDEDIVPLMRFYDRASKIDGFVAGVRESLAAILSSPHFLYRAEAAVDDGARELNDLELASRLSFFLWSSSPDDTLLKLASSKQLHNRAVLDSQVRRMLADKKSDALIDNFAGEWLGIRNSDHDLEGFAPDAQAYGAYDKALGDAFFTEARLFLQSILRENRSVMDVVTANYSFLNERLADAIDLGAQTKHAHWNVKGPHFIALHELFDKVAESVEDHIDDIAERITALGGTAYGTIRAAAKATSLKAYPEDITEGMEHVEALSSALADFGKKVRKGIDQTGKWGDADTADLLTGISRDIDKYLWFLEAHLQAKR